MNQNIIESVLHVVGCELDPKELALKDGKSIAELLDDQEKNQKNDQSTESTTPNQQ